MTTQALAYLRTSSATNVGGDSDVRQRIAIQQYADSAGLTIAHEFYDADVKGADSVDQRKGFNSLLAYARESGVSTVIIENAGRFARDTIVQELGVKILQARGIQLFESNGTNLTDSTDPGRVMIRQILGAVYQMEKSQIVNKLRGARDRKSAELGRRCEGRPDFTVCRPDLHTALLDARAHAPHATQSQIAAMLARQGFLSAGGKPYSQAQISRFMVKLG